MNLFRPIQAKSQRSIPTRSASEGGRHGPRWRFGLVLILLTLTASIAAGAVPSSDGMIEGVVLRAGDNKPLAGAEVILRATIGGETLPMAKTTADAKGRFRFEHLVADAACVYVPGANRGGVHYPGPRVQLTSRSHRAEVVLIIHESVAFPNPLVVRRHTITLEPEPGVLRVTESMLIDNPTAACYVGQAAAKDAAPITLQLSIPAEFQRVTFAEEFFGRRFLVFNGKLITDIPWPPGKRELTFTYVLPNTERHCVWQRPLDLPSTRVRVAVCDVKSDPAASPLAKTASNKAERVAFDSGDRTLAAGYPLRVELGDMPVSLMRYAPWAAAAVLVGVSLATCLSMVRRRK